MEGVQVAGTPSRHSASAVLGEGRMSFNNLNSTRRMEFVETQLDMAPQASNNLTKKKKKKKKNGGKKWIKREQETSLCASSWIAQPYRASGFSFHHQKIDSYSSSKDDWRPRQRDQEIDNNRYSKQSGGRRGLLISLTWVTVGRVSVRATAVKWAARGGWHSLSVASTGT